MDNIDNVNDKIEVINNHVTNNSNNKNDQTENCKNNDKYNSKTPIIENSDNRDNRGKGIKSLSNSWMNCNDNNYKDKSFNNTSKYNDKK